MPMLNIGGWFSPYCKNCYDKINHAYAYGGAELSIKTINQTFGLNIEDFVAVDFKSLPKIIDILGKCEKVIGFWKEELKNLDELIKGPIYRDVW